MLINSVNLLKEAKEKHYAVAHFNINNLEWTKYILEEMNELKKPVILGVSEGAIRYMGGSYVVSNVVKSLIMDLNIEIPVVLHLDHGSSYEACKKCIDDGFTSVMIDASKKSLEENIELTKKVVSYAHIYNVSVEGEIGKIGGTEDELNSKECNAKKEDVITYVKETGVDSVAPALGSVHGLYKGVPNLDFETMLEINETISTPLVLHGGTGIPDNQIKKAISCGISKININTELQLAWSHSIKKYIETNQQVYDPRKIISSGEESIKKCIKDKIRLFYNI